MPSKYWSQHLLLRSLTVSKKKDLSEKIIANLSPDHFVLDTYKLAFKRLHSLYLKKGRLLTWKELIFDSSLPERVRDKLRIREIKRQQLSTKDKALLLPRTYDEVTVLLESNWYNAVHSRIIKLQNKLTEDLSRSPGNEEINRIYEEVEKSLTDIKSLSSTSGTILHLSKPIIRDTMAGFRHRLKNNFFLPTGFKDFDNKNLGIPLDSYFLISGKTGSGKSTLALQLALNMKRSGARVCFLPLEMSVEQMLIRIASSLMQVGITKIVKNFDYYEKKVVKSINKFMKKEDNSPECFDFYLPEAGETLVDVLIKLKPYQYDIIFVDYVNLLSPLDREDWKSLDKAGRAAKVWATNNKTVVCLLAQLDAEKETVRYSKALEEHASNMWVWPENKDKIAEVGYITIKQPKARNQDPFTFKLSVDLSISRISNYTNGSSVVNKQADGLDDIPLENDI